jgi:uncharacterized alpha-E superfamily protein
MANPPFTPPRSDVPILDFMHFDPQTPGPARARINNLQNQVSELVRENKIMKRKHKSEDAEWQARSSTLEGKLKEADGELKRLKGVEGDIERCKAEGEGMRDEVRRRSRSECAADIGG